MIYKSIRWTSKKNGQQVRREQASTLQCMGTLCRETVATFVTHSGPVLVIAWIGFASTVAAIQGFQSLTGLTPVTDLLVYSAGAVVGMLLHALAQGALAYIGLHGDFSTSKLSLADALSASLRGWRRLMPGALLHAVLTFVCALSLTPLLISSGLVAINLEPIDPSPDSLPRLAATRSIDTAMLGVLHPFGAWVAPARMVLLPMFLRTEMPDPDAWIAFEIKNHMDPSRHHELQVYEVPMAALPAGLIALAGLALLFADVILLRFYAASAMRLGTRAVSVLTGAISPVLESARLGVQHTRLVFRTAVVLRVLARALQILCLILTISAVETMVIPQLAWSTGAQWVAPLGRLACLVGSAAVSAILSAFCNLYDARLYVAIGKTSVGLPKTKVI